VDLRLFSAREEDVVPVEGDADALDVPRARRRGRDCGQPVPGRRAGCKRLEENEERAQGQQGDQSLRNDPPHANSFPPKGVLAA
jgi:hypothetical protein